jgi:hypothetical protein
VIRVPLVLSRITGSHYAGYLAEQISAIHNEKITLQVSIIPPDIASQG